MTTNPYFKNQGYKPTQNLFDELFETNKDLALDIMNIAYEKPHDYLVLNVDTQKIYKGYDEIIVNCKQGG